MKTHLIVAASLILGSMFSGLIGRGELSAAIINSSLPSQDETIQMTTTPNQPTQFTFGAADGFADAVVEITLARACTVRVTRFAVPSTEVSDRCRGTLLQNSTSVPEQRNPNGPPGPAQTFVYRIETVGACPPEAFPVQIDINYFGAGSPIRTRIVRDALPPGGDCRDVSTDVVLPKDPTNLDPRVRGLERSFSDYFLVRLADADLPSAPRINLRFDELKTLTTQSLPSQLNTVNTAQTEFNRGVDLINQLNTSEARKFLLMSIQTLRSLETAVLAARNQNQITPLPAAELQARAQQTIFAIRQFAALNMIEL
jgi:hypothetical protein